MAGSGVRVDLDPFGVQEEVLVTVQPPPEENTTGTLMHAYLCSTKDLMSS